jgi:hypothetical protein
MIDFIQILTAAVEALTGSSATFFTSFPDSILSGTGGLTLAFAAVAVIPAEVSANIRKWHGNIDEQFDSINNLVNTVNSHQPGWGFPAELLSLLNSNRDQLVELIARCRSNCGSPADRTVRNTLLKTTVGLCLTQVRTWAYTQYYEKIITVDDVHLLGFFLPGETGGYRSRREPTDVLAEVKVGAVNMDFIRIVIDQAENKNAAPVRHGWPKGVRNALIVIMAADGVTEVYRQMTTRLHNDIKMPEGSHGKQFIIKAAFLAHVDDEPKFGNEPTFSMPLTTEDLVAALDRQHHEDYEKLLREVEQHRQEVERMHGEQKPEQ